MYCLAIRSGADSRGPSGFRALARNPPKHGSAPYGAVRVDALSEEGWKKRRGAARRRVPVARIAREIYQGASLT
jgi:hypothetical protein